MKHPLIPHTDSHLWVVLLSGTFILMLLLRFIDPSPSIVAMEFAGNVKEAGSIMKTWGESGKNAARLSTYIDFIFLIFYSTTIALFCLKMANKWKTIQWIFSLGILLAWGQWLAAGLDTVENIAMLTTIGGNPSNTYPVVAYWCAAVKFGLVGLGILYVILTFLFKRY